MGCERIVELFFRADELWRTNGSRELQRALYFDMCNPKICIIAVRRQMRAASLAAHTRIRSRGKRDGKRSDKRASYGFNRALKSLFRRAIRRFNWMKHSFVSLSCPHVGTRRTFSLIGRLTPITLISASKCSVNTRSRVLALAVKVRVPSTGWYFQIRFYTRRIAGLHIGLI